MRATVTCLLAFFAMVASPVFSQTVQDVVVNLTATVDVATPLVSLTWDTPEPAEIYVFRREKGSTDWFIIGQATGTTANAFDDDLVDVGQTYEYGIQRTIGGITAYGYLTVPVEAAIVDQRGTISVFVEEALEAPLATELERLRLDLIGDGWQVLWHSVTTSATVASVKSQIVDDYDNSGINSVFLLGEIPVPYSGNTAWDGHPEHQGAWPADAYYGDIDDTFWTDNAVNTATNTTAPGRTETVNVPGDGKFDNDFVPTTSEVSVGRVDFSNLSEATFGATRTELYRRYLDKDHKWRTKQYTVDNKALVDDNFGYFSGEAFAENGYRTGNALVGPSNVVDGNFFEDTNDQSFLYAYGTGPGTYTSAGGVGNSDQFATDTVNAVFMQLFGSYHGDWDYSSNPFMMSALASKGGVLNCSWVGRPHYFTHHIGAGETIGSATLETQNACDNAGYFASFGACGAHVSLLGDPTIRAQIVAPVTNLVATPLCDKIDLTWAASAQQNVIGYHVYRSNALNGLYDRLTTNALTGLSYSDNAPLTGDVYYMVKAVVREETPSGIFFNTSTGASVGLNFAPGVPPTINVPATVALNCNTTKYQLGSCGPGVICYVTGPGQNNSPTPVSIELPGTYTIIATSITTGCTATATMTVTADYVLPTLASDYDNYDCQAHSAQLFANSTPSNVTYAWGGPAGFTSTEQNPVVTVSGGYTLTVTLTTNGCTASTGLTIPPFTVPGANATGGDISCAAPSVQLLGSSGTSGVTYFWTGPNGFESSEQNPTVTSVGDYTLTVTAANGCTSTAQASVGQQGDLPQANPTASGSVGCIATPITLTANPDAQGYSFLWSGPGGFTSTEENPVVTAAGVYSVQVTNTGSGCSSTASVTVLQTTDLPTANPMSSGNLTCLDTFVVLTANPGSANFNLAWTGPNGFTSTAPNPAVNTAGNYNLTVTNPSNGCSSNFTVVVLNLVTPPSNLDIDDFTIGCGVPSAEYISLLTLCANPGSQFTCQLDGEPAGLAITSGDHYFVIYDLLTGCPFAADSFHVTTDTISPSLSVLGNTDLLCADDVTTLNAVSTALNPIFQWTGLGNNPVQTVPVGEYTVVVTAQNGCTASQTVTVSAPPALSISDIIVTIDCAGFVTPSVTAVGGEPPYTIGYFPQPPFPPNTMYEIGVTDANGCQVGTTGNTGAAPAPITGTTTHTNETVLGENDGSATVQATGGTAPYSYLWSNGQTTQTINNLAPGTYTCTITDAAGCTASVTVVVLEGVNATTDLPGLRRISLSPNPTGGRFELSLELENALPVQVELVDVAGRILTKTSLENVLSKTWQFDLSASPSGVYFCKIMAEGKVAVLKVVRME